MCLIFHLPYVRNHPGGPKETENRFISVYFMCNEFGSYDTIGSDFGCLLNADWARHSSPIGIVLAVISAAGNKLNTYICSAITINRFMLDRRQQSLFSRKSFHFHLRHTKRMKIVKPEKMPISSKQCIVHIRGQKRVALGLYTHLPYPLDKSRQMHMLTHRFTRHTMHINK